MRDETETQERGDSPPPIKKQKLEVNEDTEEEQKEPPPDNPESQQKPEEEYTNFVTPEEVEKLREFRVLDEVKSNEEDSNDDDSDSSTGDSAELPEEEIEKMLEENLPEDFKAAPKPKEKPYVTREKIILEEKGVNHFEVLPLDWIMIRHQSGMPVYVHRSSRVCTLSKPYFLGKGNAKRHNIPISAIPCLAYRRALEEEEKQKLIDEKVEEQIKLGTWKSNNKAPDKTSSKTDGKDQVGSTTTPVSNVSSHTNNEEFSKENQTENLERVTIESNNSESLPRQCPFKHKAINNNANVCPASDVEMSAAQSIENDNSNLKSGSGSENLVSQDCEMTDNTSQVDSNAKDSNVNENGVHDTEDVVTEENKTEVPPSTTDNIEIPPNRQPIVLPGGIVMPSPRVETVNTSWKTQHLTHEQVNDYCKKLFKFRVLNIMHFKRWADRRKYTKARKALQYPMLPEGTKLITIPVQSTSGQETTGGGKPAKRDWVMNMNGRSYLSVFHEYVLHALKKQPVYEFKQLENASSPYQATVYIGGMQYGVGHGSSKRQAKSAAARASIHILIPELRDHLEPDVAAEPDFVFFDYVTIEDPRIAEFCAATCEPTPHAILRTCLLRNFGAGDRHIHTEIKKLEYQKIELTMKVGKHSATVVCKNKKTAKQRASQAILQALHPHVRSWGSLLRLYGSRSVKSCKERKLEEQQITLLQDRARHNEPNRAVLDKLRHEMRRLAARDAALAPLGTLTLPSADLLPTHSASNLRNVDL